MELVVAATEADQVVALGLTEIRVVLDVVHLHEPHLAAGYPATLVAVLDHPAEARRNAVLCAPNTEWDVVVFPDRLQRAVAQQVVTDRRRQDRAVGELCGAGVRVHEHMWEEALAPLCGGGRK